MKTNMQYIAVIMSAFLMLTGTALAQNTTNSTNSNLPSNNTSENSSQLGDGVISYNFNIQGLPAEASNSDDQEVDAEREFEADPDENENFTISEDEAERSALEALGSEEWNLDSSEKSDGLYVFEYQRGESEAEVEIDGSTGEVTSLEGEVEYEPEESRDDPVIRLSGFIEFNTGGYEVDIESEEENSNADFTVRIEEPEESATQAVTRTSVEEDLEAESGRHTVNLEVVRDGETVLQRTKEVTVPESQEDSESSEEDNQRFEQDPENMTREELIEEVKDLREQVLDLSESMNRPDEDSNQRQGPPEDVPGQPGEDEEENESESNESEERGQGPPTDTPGQGSDNRPGFVNNLLNGIFG